MPTPSERRSTKNAAGVAWCRVVSAMRSRSAADVTFSGQASAIGWMPICSLMMNSMRARPTPSLGRIAVLNARSGLPRLTMIGVRGLRERGDIHLRDLDRNAGRHRRGRSPLRRRKRSPPRRPSASRVAPAAPTMAAMPSSRATIAA